MSIHLLNEVHGKSASELLFEIGHLFDKKKQRRHELWILSCYVELDLIEEYSYDLLKTIRLTDVYLAFNFSEIYKFGPKITGKKLLSIESNLRKKGINFKWMALASSKLVHSKGYALIQRASDKISDGAVLITSANFTNPGFKKGGNVELGYISTTKKDINRFVQTYNYLWDALGKGTDSAIFQQENYLLKFALLSSGLFLHKWSGNLSQQIGIRYELTPFAKEKGAIAPELAAVGFAAGDTFTRQVLKMSELPKKEISPTFIKRFTIETYWGRWCPKSAWNELSESFEGASQFIQQFQNATETSVLAQAKKEALAVQFELINKGLIEPVKQDHLENWAVRIEELRSNIRRLERFYIGYEAHELPYSIEQKSDVQELFDSMEEGINLSKSMNIAKNKMAFAIKEANPDLIFLSPEDVQIIRDMKPEDVQIIRDMNNDV